MEYQRAAPQGGPEMRGDKKKAQVERPGLFLLMLCTLYLSHLKDAVGDAADVAFFVFQFEV
jgi:hypothetical protein